MAAVTNPSGMVDKADENRKREVTQEYLNFLDDSVSFLNTILFNKIPLFRQMRRFTLAKLRR